MFLTTPLDVASPGVLAAAAGVGLAGLCLLNIVIILVEAVVLWRQKWGSFRQSLLASSAMNIATTLLGFTIVPMTISLQYVGLEIDFLLSVLVEALVLMLFNRGTRRKALIASLLANIASYLLIILPIYAFTGLLK